MNFSRRHFALFIVLFLAALLGVRWLWKAAPVGAAGGTRVADLQAERAPADVVKNNAVRPESTPLPAPAVVPLAATRVSAIPEMAQFNAWAARYLAAAGGEKAALLEEGRALARARRAALAQLIVKDPRQALEEAVPMVVRQQLPAAVVAQLEERVSAQGFFGVLAVLGGPAEAAPIRREVRLPEGRRFEAYVYGRRTQDQTRASINVSGIALDAALALDERPFRVLEKGEVPAAGRAIVETCPISGKSTAVTRTEGALPPITEATPAVEIAGTIHYLCDGGHIHALEEQMVAEEGSTGGAVKPTGTIASSQSTGVRSLLYMRVAFPESNREPQTETAAYDMMRQVNDWFVESSYGNVYLVTTVTPLLILPHTEAWYTSGTTGGGDEYDVRNDAQALARQLGYDTNQYDLDIVVYNGGPGGFGGLGYVGGKGTWLKSISVGVACHELGHNFGVWHANYWDTTGLSVIGPGANAEYGNTFDTMGSASAGDLHFNANFKSILNWLPKQTFVQTVTTSGMYRLYAYDQPRLDPANRYALRVKKDTAREYWAEFRQRSLSGNKWTRDGLLLNWSAWASSNSGAQLLDTTPGSPDGKTDAPVTIGTTYSDFEAGIHLTPIGKGGTVPESMDVVVNLGAFPGNQAPGLILAASATTAAVSATVNFTATASDPDGDALSYAWDFGDKTFSATNSPAVSKAWSAAGDYTVRCVVSDMKGATVSKVAVVRVGAPGTFRVSGQVTRAGQPVANVRVHNGLTGTSYRGSFTNSDGTYVITGLAAGSYTFGAALEGYSFVASGFANPLSIAADVAGANFTATQTATVTMTASDASATETAGDTGKFTLTRTGPAASALTVNFFTPSGSATRTSDYTLSPDLVVSGSFSTATFPAGQASLDLVLTAVNDSTAEGPELAQLELAPGAGYAISGAAQAAVVIQDDDTANPVVSLRVGKADALEGGNSASFLISRTGATTAALTVSFTVSGTATNGTDYTSIGSQILIPAGSASVPLFIAPINDTAVEGVETVTVTLATSTSYVRAPAAAENTGTINLLDDDIATVTVAATDATASEALGDPGTFVLTRTGNLAQPLTVNYALTGGALQGVDYLPLPGVLTIPAGLATGSVTITPIDDGIGEAAQTVVLQLRGGLTYAVGSASNATITIADNGDLPVVTLGVSDGVAGEPADTGKFKFTTAGTGSGNITIHYTVTGSAVAGQDYVALPGTLSIAKNTSVDVTLTPLDDALPEGLRTVTVTIDPDPAYTTHLDTSATINLLDDDQPLVHVSANNTTVAETGTTGLFYLSRTGATTNALTVNYTMSGTATNGTDYAALPGTATIAAGATGVVVTVTPLDDALFEGTETIVMNVAPGAYGFGLPSALLYLTDNETSTLQVKFSSASASGSESAGTVSLPVVLSAAAAGPVTVEYVNGGGTAAAGVDYQFTPGTLTFLPGETAKSIPLTVLDDAFLESAQTVLIKLQNANGAALGTSTFTYTINDNDTAPLPTVGFTATAGSGLESVSPAVIVVSLSAAQATPVSVNYAVTGGTATSGTDFTLSSGTLTFAAGETARLIPNTIVNDTAVESGETILLALSSPAGATLGANATHTFTITDDDAATVTVAATDASANEAGDTGTFTLTRTGSTAAALTVNLAVGGTAANGTDYQALASTAAIAAGQASVAILVKPVDDSLGESDETVTLTVAAGGGYTVGAAGSATVTITDDSPLVTIAAPDASASEAGPDLAAFTLTRSGNLGVALPVNVTLGGTAASGSDYVPLAGPWVIPAGASSATFVVTPIDDASQESTETLIATVTGGSGYLLNGATTATVTILDNDQNSAPTISLLSPAATSVAIRDGVGLLLEASVTDDGRPTPPSAVTAAWNMVSGPGAVTFGNANAATTSARFSTPGIYGLRLTASDGALQTVLNVTVSVVTTFDGITNTGPLVAAGGTLSVTTPEPANLAGTVTDDGLPASPSAVSTTWLKLSGPGSVTFADPAALTTTAGLSTAGTYVLRLVAHDGAVKTFDDLTVTSALPVVSLTADLTPARELHLAKSNFTVARTGSTANALTVAFTTSGTATEGSDYVALGGSVVIPAGQSSAPVTIVPLADALSEGDEQVAITLTADPAYALGTSTSAALTLTDLPFDAWRKARFGALADDPTVAGSDLDLDGDGLKVFLEFALFGDPALFDAPPEAGQEPGFLTLTYRRNLAAEDLTFSFEETLDLQTWQPATATEEILTDDGLSRLIKARIPTADEPLHLIRLKVTGN